MKKLIIISLVLICPFLSYSQNVGGDEIIKAVRSAGASVSSLECDYIQTRENPMLKDKITSSGHIFYQAPGKLKLESISPQSGTFIINGNGVSIKNESGTKVIDTNRNRMLRALSSMIFDLIEGRIFDGNGNVDIRAEISAKLWIITIEPHKKQFWNSLSLIFDPEVKTAKGVEIKGKAGDRTVMEFKNILVNKGMPSSTFEL